MIFFILPVKVKWLGWLQAAFLLWTILSACLAAYWAGAIAPLVSLANYLLSSARISIGDCTCAFDPRTIASVF